MLLRFVDQHGTLAVRRSIVFEGVKLGQWVESVKSRWRNRASACPPEGSLRFDSRLAVADRRTIPRRIGLWADADLGVRIDRRRRRTNSLRYSSGTW